MSSHQTTIEQRIKTPDEGQPKRAVKKYEVHSVCLFQADWVF